MNIRYDKNVEGNDDENYFSNALKELLQKFSSIKNPGGEDEHLQECIQSCAEIGDESGMCTLADALLRGVGTNVDVHQALKLYRKATNLKCVRV
ncbi:2638_t:CDS:2, partial [Ambispora gerdemannii]